MSKITANVTGNGTVNVSFAGGTRALVYAFQQTANPTSVNIKGSDGTNATLTGEAGTRGNLTFLQKPQLLFLKNQNKSYSFTLKSGSLVTASKIKLGTAKDISFRGVTYQDTCVITCEDSTDMDYNDLTVIISWFKDEK